MVAEPAALGVERNQEELVPFEPGEQLPCVALRRALREEVRAQRSAESLERSGDRKQLQDLGRLQRQDLGHQVVDHQLVVTRELVRPLVRVRRLCDGDSRQLQARCPALGPSTEHIDLGIVERRSVLPCEIGADLVRGEAEVAPPKLGQPALAAPSAEGPWRVDPPEGQQTESFGKLLHHSDDQFVNLPGGDQVAVVEDEEQGFLEHRELREQDLAEVTPRWFRLGVEQHRGLCHCSRPLVADGRHEIAREALGVALPVAE